MKRIGYFLLVVILLTILVGGVSCQSGTATPEGKMKLFLRAVTELDSEGISQYYVGEDRERVKADIEQYTVIQVYPFAGRKVKIEVLSQSDTTAKVKLIWEGNGGGPLELHARLSREFNLVKQDGEWLIKIGR